jgi:hypothetical protein
VSEHAFRDADPGDVLNLKASLADGRPLPRWVRFDGKQRAFVGDPPASVFEELTVRVVASDVDGMEASACFVIRRREGSRG